MVDFFDFIWSIIKTVKDTFISIVTFLKDLITLIPDFLNILPSEIKYILVPVILILIAISIYKLVKWQY